MTSQFQESNTAIISTIKALDEFHELENLQTLVELALQQFDYGSDGAKRAAILIEVYLKNSSEHARSVRKALESAQNALVHIKQVKAI